MVDRQTRMKKKKFRKTPGAKTSTIYTREKNTKAKCAVTGKILAGTANQAKANIRATSKTKRKPSVKFGGILSGNARKQVWENYALVSSKKKTIEDIPVKVRKFVKDMIGEKK